MDMINSGPYIEDAGLFDFAASCARLSAPGAERSGRMVWRRLREDYSELRRCHELIASRYEQLASPPPACEWLLDNWYMVQREYRSAYTLSEVKRLRSGGDSLLIFELCAALLRSGHGKLTEERLRLFLRGYQSVIVLRRSELGVFDLMLRAAIISALAAVCRNMLHVANTDEYTAALAALFGSLRLLTALDMEKLLSDCDMISALLDTDPSGEYPRMDSDTKHLYLIEIQKLARRAGVSEHSFAQNLIEQAQEQNIHVGLLLFPPKKRKSGLYIAANVLLTLFFTLIAAFLVESAAAALLLLLPMSELVKTLLDFILLRLISPRHLPRMDMREGVRENARSICVVSVLLSENEGRNALISRLEQLRLGNIGCGKNLCFGLLADLPAAAIETTDRDAALISDAREAVNTLNLRYGGGFYLFTRGRSFDGESWYAHERKRGAMIELAKLLCDEPSELSVSGERDLLTGIRYIITLDSDTLMYPGAASELIGAAAHPLNRPIIDAKRRIVTGGHAIIQPRISTELQSSGATDFAIVFAGTGGSDPYGSLCGELYMDAFESGGFAGKGIIDARALLDCTAARFPDGCILSHDALEGAYLRGAFMGDVEFSDRFPANPLSFYKRLHRWTRGDWQNLPWILRRGRDLPDIERWRLFDSLRRSLISPLTLIAILFGFLLDAEALQISAWAALISLTCRLFISLAECGFARRDKYRLRRYSRILSGFGGAIVQSFIRLWLLPYDAWVCLSAIFTSLWRMLISRRRLLEWQTAAQSEKMRGGFAAYLRAMWFPVFLGAVLLLLSPLIIGKAAALMWMLSPVAAAALALPAYKSETISESDRRFIIDSAAESWRYLSEFSTVEDNFLPPDNFQEQPPVGIAHRTSPTNIGLALVSALAASDMGIIPAERATAYISSMLGTIEKMPRCRGHLYNWYDTRSLHPLEPAYVSTVDSGNLYASLIAVRQALMDWGEEKLAARVSKLMGEMDFSTLYDRARGLFYICYDSKKNCGAGGWYDLMASEAMLTSYIAIAKGDVPIKHWRRLSRAQLQKDGYRGFASWTGTMFEYLMPQLFLPVARGSLLYESDRFCLYAQRRRTPPGIPWGISESAFFMLDGALNYRYKAHGCSALALKRGQEADMVISPYSSFLALAVEQRAAVKNLRRLRDMGAVGRYGYIEALDFTPGRCLNSDGEQVRCYMAHHVGMSIIAAANAVCDGSIRRRFMADGAMASFALLLQERLPSAGPVIRRDLSEIPEKPPQSFSEHWQLRGGSDDNALRCTLLSNGAYNLLVTNSGLTNANLGGTAVYSDEGVKIELNGSYLLPSNRHSLWEFNEQSCHFTTEFGGISCRSSVSVAAGDRAEKRTVELLSETDAELKLYLSFVPILAQFQDYVNHPAFWKLGIHAEVVDGVLLLRRLARGNTPELWLCLACDCDAVFTTDEKGALEWLSRPHVNAELNIRLSAGKKRAVRFAICTSHTRAEAIDGAHRCLSDNTEARSMVSAAAALLKMNASELGAAMEMLPDICFKRTSGGAAKSELWRFGMSGDLPIICCDGNALESEKILLRFLLLKSCGINADLVYFSDEQGEYMQPLRRRISKLLAGFGLEALIDCHSGVHFAPLAARSLIASRAVLCVGEQRRSAASLPAPQLSEIRRLGTVPVHCWENGSFSYYVNRTLPTRTWQHILTNGSFSYIATDSGIGNMWYKNAREMPINLPPRSVSEVSGSETVWLMYKGSPVSIFAANDGYPCRVSFSPGLAVWEKELGERKIRTTAFIPFGTDARLLLIEGAEGLKLTWKLELTLNSADGMALSCRYASGLFRAESADAYIRDAAFYARCSESAECSCDFAQPAMLLECELSQRSILVCGCCEPEAISELCKPNIADTMLKNVCTRWAALLDRLRLKTGSRALDDYMGHWAAYQSIACRLEARGSLYQSGGAFGFRDQLQDAVNMLLLTPHYAKERILDSCRHQYIEGDVMHWWHEHPEGDRGVRTRCSDDLLWLVWALCEYCERSGDYDICELDESYVNSPALADTERDRYEVPDVAGSGTVLEHAQRAIDRCIKRGFGAHGLPLFGSGDWNDGLDNVEGESVWLAWFLSICTERFAALLSELCKPGTEHYLSISAAVAKAAENAWTGEFYRRGYYADGSVLGGEQLLDSIAQSWAALCPNSPKEHKLRALNSALCKLVDREHKLVRLFSPAYRADTENPGYIASYGEGFRENGGQYTHGAIWLALACFENSMPDEGWEILKLLLPASHELSCYEAEPFVLAADVYSAPGHEGEAGWSWYTGSAGWYFRVVTEHMLGLQLHKGKLYVRPKLPCSIPGFAAQWTDYSGTKHNISVIGEKVTVDGQEYDGSGIG